MTEQPQPEPTQNTVQRPYDRPANPGDADLVLEFKNLFLKMGMEDKIRVFDSNRHLVSAVGKHWEAQRWHLNRFVYETLLCVMPFPITLNQAMLRDGTPGDWLHNMRLVVIPYFIEKNLPV